MIRVLDTCAPTSPESAAPAQNNTSPAANEVPSEPAPAKDTSTQIHGLVSEPSPAPTFEEPTPEPVPEPEPVYEEPVVEQPSFEYANCCAVWQALGRSIWVGEPGFHSALDGNGDGEGCERRPRNCH
nr:excalibur calcium-binding domain-containing protein [Schaalia canis]